MRSTTNERWVTMTYEDDDKEFAAGVERKTKAYLDVEPRKIDRENAWEMPALIVLAIIVGWLTMSGHYSIGIVTLLIGGAMILKFARSGKVVALGIVFGLLLIIAYIVVVFDSLKR